MHNLMNDEVKIGKFQTLVNDGTFRVSYPTSNA